MIFDGARDLDLGRLHVSGALTAPRRWRLRHAVEPVLAVLMVGAIVFLAGWFLLLAGVD
jgi:hypothetical protein